MYHVKLYRTDHEKTHKIFEKNNISVLIKHSLSSWAFSEDVAEQANMVDFK